MATTYEHEFESTHGDEYTTDDLKNATWKVTETFVDVTTINDNILVVFTHRIEPHSVDDLLL